MRGGKLRHIVDIQQPARSADGFGEQVPSWSNFATGLYAQVEPLSGNERIQAQQINANVNYMVRIRYCPGVTPSMRVIYGSRTLQITNVQDVLERNREMELLCIEQQ